MSAPEPVTAGSAYLNRERRSLAQALADRMKDCPECLGEGWYEGRSIHSIYHRCTECGGAGKVEKGKFDE